MPDPPPSTIVFGGTGFIGGSFARYSAQAGDPPFVCGNVASKTNGDESVLRFDARDLKKCVAAFEVTRPKLVVLSISQLTPRSTEEIADSRFTELTVLDNIERCIQRYGANQFLDCSSGGGIYGDAPEAHDEATPLAPKSAYAQMKIDGEALALRIGRQCLVGSTILRIANAYGPGQSPLGLHGVVAVFVYRLLKGLPIEVFGSTAAGKDYVYIDDVSAAIAACFKTGATGVYNIGSGTFTSLATIIAKVSRACDIEPNISSVSLSPTEVSTFVLDTAKARRDLAWEPLVGLDDGISRTKRWIESRFCPG